MELLFLIFETPELLFLVPIVAAFALYIYCLADCIRNNQLMGNSKLLWLIIILIVPFIGSLIYLNWYLYEFVTISGFRLTISPP